MNPYALLQQQAEREHIVSTVVGIILVENGHVLLLERRPDDFAPNLWEVPGGHIDPGETIPEAARRELLEETDLVLLDPIAHVGGYDYPGEFGLTRQWNVTGAFSGSKIIHPEHVAYRWECPRTWGKLLMSPDMRRSLDDFASTYLTDHRCRMSVSPSADSTLE